MTNTPEHDQREQASGLHPDVTAAYDYVESVRHTADVTQGHWRAWYGWALREAFLAGVSHCQRLAEDAAADPGEGAAVS